VLGVLAGVDVGAGVGVGLSSGVGGGVVSISSAAGGRMLTVSMPSFSSLDQLQGKKDGRYKCVIKNDDFGKL
jgi:hypothetical protein